MANNMTAGNTITSEDIRVVPWPEKFLPKNAYFENPQDVVGRLVRSDITAGEPVFKEKLAGDKSSGGLPVLIPAGYRAVTVGVSEIKGVAGFVKPGDRVDVLGTFQDKGTDNEEIRITKTVLQNVLVMASAQQMIREGDAQAEEPDFLKEEDTAGPDADAKKGKKKRSDSEIEKARKERAKERKEQEKRAKSVSSVTLALTPEQAERMTLAEESGEIRLVLRAEGDAGVADSGGVTDRDLLTTGSLPDGKQWPFKFAAPPPAPPMPKGPALAVPDAPPIKMPGRSVELLEGTEKTSVGF
jgi:pilus assembly protein CpaB